LEIGEWLKYNGEAIYNTRRWKTPVQWSAGRRDYKGGNEHITGDWKTGGDIMLKLTVDPDQGYATKEIFFTYNPTTNSLYAIFPKYPEDKKLVLKNIELTGAAKLSLLSNSKKLTWSQKGPDVEIELPDFNLYKMKAPYAFAVKIENFGRFASKPTIKTDYSKDPMKPSVTLSSSAMGAEIYYTTDGSDPSRSTAKYTAPFTLQKSGIVKAIAVGEITTVVPPMDNSDMLSSAIIAEPVKVYEWKKALTIKKPAGGISYKYFEPPSNEDVLFSSIDKTPTSSGVTDRISIALKKRVDRFAFEFTGYIKIEKDGIYNFYLESDDGSRMYIDDDLVVDNGGYHGTVEKDGKAALKKGYHKLQIQYFDAGGGNALKFSMQNEAGVKTEVSASVLYH